MQKCRQKETAHAEPTVGKVRTSLHTSTPACLQNLGRALGHFVFSLIGLKRILFTNIFQKL